MIYLISVILILSIIINFILLYGLYVCYNKINIYENWVNYFGSKIQSIYDRLKLIDEMNLFEKDDHVGFVFSEIKNVIENFNKDIK